ncbi:MAG: luciferase family protein [Anaerolineales bacterium]
MRGGKDCIVKEVTGWPGIHTEPGRLGSTAFMLASGREAGHIHGDSVVDIACRGRQCEDWIAAGRAERHRFAPGFGVSVQLRKEEDVKNALELLRESHGLLNKKS